MNFKHVFFSISFSIVVVLLVACDKNNALDSDVPSYLDPKTTVAPYVACFDSQSIPLVSVHRGGPLPGLPENALESLQAATAYGPMLLEVDVRETADGELVLLHDSNLERTTNSSGKLSDYTWEQLEAVKLKDNDGALTDFSVPRLDEVLAWADNKAIIQLDVKRGVDYKQVANAVVEADAVDSVLIIAYRIEDAVNALQVNKDLSFSISINDLSDLNALDKAGIPRNQIVAWTGVVRDMDKPIWSQLQELNIPTAAGAFWDLEAKIIQTGNTQLYLTLAKNHVDVIGSDHYKMAFDTLTERKLIDNAIQACEGI